MTRGWHLFLIVLSGAGVGLAAHVRASTLGDAGPQLRVPVSAFARPAAWLDPSRLSLASTVSFATSSSGQTQGLQVTSLRYQLAAPWALQVSVGSALGRHAGQGGGVFLEGVDLSYRPSAATWFQLRYRDVRSPLQLSRSWGY